MIQQVPEPALDLLLEVGDFEGLSLVRRLWPKSFVSWQVVYAATQGRVLLCTSNPTPDPAPAWPWSWHLTTILDILI